MFATEVQYEANSGVSLTEPDMTLSLQLMLQRHLSGIPAQGNPNLVYDSYEDDIDMDSPAIQPISDISELEPLNRYVETVKYNAKTHQEEIKRAKAQKTTTTNKNDDDEQEQSAKQS